MAEWTVTFRASFNGVTAIVEAETEDEAMGKANSGELNFIDTSGAELVNWQINSIEKNE